jgi:hypothetical protein
MGIHSSPYSNHEASREFWAIVDRSYKPDEVAAIRKETDAEYEAKECPNCLRNDGKHDRTCPLRPYDWAADFDDMAWD